MKDYGESLFGIASARMGCMFCIVLRTAFFRVFRCSLTISHGGTAHTEEMPEFSAPRSARRLRRVSRYSCRRRDENRFVSFFSSWCSRHAATVSCGLECWIWECRGRVDRGAKCSSFEFRIDTGEPTAMRVHLQRFRASVISAGCRSAVHCAGAGMAARRMTRFSNLVSGFHLCTRCSG